MLKQRTGPEDAYGLTTEELRVCLLKLTGSEHGANDAMASIAEWLDTARRDIPDFTEATGGILSDTTRETAVIVTSGFVTALSMAAESSVTDSDYEMVATVAKDEPPTRRRILKHRDI